MKAFILVGKEKEISLGNQYVTFVNLKDEWHLSSYPGFQLIYYERICHGSRLILEDSLQELYILRFSMYSVDYDHFKAYERKNLLIGPSIECDVYVQDKLCPLVNLDIAAMKLHLLKEEEVYLNGKQYKNEVLKNGDEVLINNLRIGIAPDCLMINQCKNILIGMKELKRVSEIQPAYPKKELVHRGFESRSDFSPLVLRLPSMELLPMHNNNMVNLSAILMAFATLSTALINSYRQYDSGRALLDYLPYLIMPMIMFISSVVLVPLTRLLETKKHKKEQLALQHRFDDYMEDLFEECEGYKEEYLANNHSDKNVFEQYVNSKEIYSRSLPFAFHLGKGMIDIPIVVENAGKDQKVLFDK
ncbi:MAG: hypothetical protein HUJ56_02250, partial [Erysipelotrichaceae bacterium]|nr:hypothetical protein [Erysipelotrichaceae bacterium]